jgi:hypothetical protein
MIEAALLLPVAAFVYVAGRKPRRKPIDPPTPEQRLARYERLRGDVADDIEATRRHVIGRHLRTTYACGGKPIRDWSRMLPNPDNPR